MDAFEKQKYQAPTAPEAADALQDPTGYTLVDEAIHIVKKDVKAYDRHGRPIIGVEDSYGEKYIQLVEQVKKQRLVSLLIRPIVPSAQVVVDSERTYTSVEEVGGRKQDVGLPIHYSHVVSLERLETKTLTKAKVAIFLCQFIVSDNDHYFTTNPALSNQNIIYEEGKYYLFDFNLAFQRQDFPVEFDPLDEEKMVPVLQTVFFKAFASTEEQTEARRILKEKTDYLFNLYHGDEGLELFKAICERVGYKNGDLSEIHPTWAENGYQKLHTHILVRIQQLRDFLQSEAT